MREQFSWIRRLSQLGTILQTRFGGIEVGRDSFGNRYYHARHTPKGQREQRWVFYAGEPEATKVPPEWHIWLHHSAANPIAANSSLHQTWQKPHQQNLTGTEQAYFPPGHNLGQANPSKVYGDYQAWNPNDQ